MSGLVRAAARRAQSPSTARRRSLGSDPRLRARRRSPRVAQRRSLRSSRGAISLSAHIEGLEAVIGPAVVPGQTACWNCCRLRRLATSDKAEADHALHASLLAERPRRRARTQPRPRQGSSATLSLLALDLLESPSTTPLAGRLLIRNLVELTTSLHTVLRLPWCEVCGGAHSALHDGAVLEGSGVQPRRRARSGRAAADARWHRRRAHGHRTEPRARLAGARAVPRGAADGHSHLERVHRGPLSPEVLRRVQHRRRQGHHRARRHDSSRGRGGRALLGGALRAEGLSARLGRGDEGDGERRSRCRVAGRLPRSRAALPLRREPVRSARLPFVRLDESARIDWVLGRWLDTGAPMYAPALPTFYDYPSCAGGGSVR